MTQANISGPAQHTATWAHSARVFRAMLPALSLVGVIWSMSNWRYFALVERSGAG